MPRPLQPSTYICQEAVQALDGLPGNPWDVLTAGEFLEALGVDDPMLANRWLYRRAPKTPPFEPQGRWCVGRGAPRVIRKDRAIAWATSQGADIPAAECWPLAAASLADLGWPGLRSAAEVQETVSFLLLHRLIVLRYPLRCPAQIGSLYVSNAPAMIDEPAGVYSYPAKTRHSEAHRSRCIANGR